MEPRSLTHGGAVIYRVTGGVIEILLVRARSDPSVWVFPKGHIEDGEMAPDTALREAGEEAGIQGELVSSLGLSAFEAPRGPVRCEYFLMRATAEVPPTEDRERRWFAPDEALKALPHKEARRVLRLALDAIE